MKHYKLIKQAIKEGYTATPEGNIIGKRNKIRRPDKNGSGYLLISLWIDKYKRQIAVGVHQFVWVFFGGKDCVSINHINGVKTDNSIKNLEESDNFRQMQHAYANGLMRDMRGDRGRLNKISHATVKSIRKACAKGAVQKDLAIKYGISKAQVSRIVNYKCWDYSKALIRKEI